MGRVFVQGETGGVGVRRMRIGGNEKLVRKVRRETMDALKRIEVRKAAGLWMVLSRKC